MSKSILQQVAERVERAQRLVEVKGHLIRSTCGNAFEVPSLSGREGDRHYVPLGEVVNKDRRYK